MKKFLKRIVNTVIILASLLLLLFNVEQIVKTWKGNINYTNEEERRLDGIFRTAEFTEFIEFPIEYGNEYLRFCIGSLTNGKKTVIVYTEETSSMLHINTGIKGMFIRDTKANEFFKLQIEEMEVPGIQSGELADYSFVLNENPYHVSWLNYSLCVVAILGLAYVIIKKIVRNRK